jgi:hypothetical protein
MNRNTRTALALVAVLAATVPSHAFAATQPRAESKDTARNDRGSVIDRIVRGIRQTIVHALEGPMIPPPDSH